MNFIIEASGLTIGYGKETILSEVDLAVPEGVLLPFIGPNGTGKTSLLKAFLGIIPVRSGSLVRRFGRIAPGYVPQQKHLDPLYPVSVRKIVTMGLYSELGFWKRPNREQRRRIDQTLERFNLSRHQ